MKRIRWVAIWMVILAGMASLSEARAAAEWLGSWRLVSPEKEPFFLRLNADQTAEATGYDGQLLGDELQGTWSEEKDRLVIRYRSGWVDVLVHRGDRVTQLSYDPGRSLDGRPQALSPAYRINLLDALDMVGGEPPTGPNLRVKGNTYVFRDSASRR